MSFYQNKWIVCLLLHVLLGTCQETKTCLTCRSGVCSLVPPNNSSQTDLCYQGNNTDAELCYNTDHLLQNGTTRMCGHCADFGFPVYLRQEITHPKMAVYGILVPADSNDEDDDSGTLDSIVIAALATCSAFGLVLVVAAFCYCWKKRNAKNESDNTVSLLASGTAHSDATPFSSN